MDTKPNREPTPIDHDYSDEKWREWADNEIKRLKVQNQDQQATIGNYRRSVELLEAKVKSAEVWMEHRRSRSVHVLDPGTKVILLGSGIPCSGKPATPKLTGTILEVTIKPKADVTYKVGYWVRSHYLTCHVGPAELQEEDTL